MNKTEANKLIQQQEISRSLLRAEIIDLRDRLAAAHRRLAQVRLPWYRRVFYVLRRHHV